MIMKRTFCGIIAILLILNLGLLSCFGAASKEEFMSQFKVVGYYSGDLFNEPVEKLQTDKLTHVIYAFLIPQEDGNLVSLEKPEQLRELVSQAHKDGAEVFIALGGWSYKGKPLVSVFESIASSIEKRNRLVEKVCLLLKEYDLDGVELDWEHPNANTINNYEKLVVELKAALDKEGKELTAALNGAWSTTAGPEVSKLITDNCLNSFSFVNVMAYDMNNNDHSPLWFAETSINYWLERGLPTEKIVLGMPLYARPSWKQYRHLVTENREYAFTDYAATEPLESYYNGINTLREKTIIALKKAGGVMVFDVNEDTEDDTSVVSMIHNLLNRTKHLTEAEMNQYITVILNKQELPFLEEEGFGIPFVDSNNRTLIPLRKPLEAIGADVSYDGYNQVVTVAKEEITVKIPIGEKIISVNDRKVLMDTEAIIKDDRTYIPLRAVFTAFGYNVEWHNSSKTIYVNKPFNNI